jgi:GrpB-like predicted nucleotidyltransferase (UPF0157 family)
VQQISIIPYNPDWPKQFEVEAEKIQQVLGENFIAIHHIGSTSVPGLSAKDIIDIACVIRNLDQAVSTLNNYTFKGEYNIPLRYFFWKNIDSSKVNLHVYEEGHPEIELNLTFRDYLRLDSKARDEYAELKAQLLQEESSHYKSHSSFTNYTLRKGDFIRKVLKQAGFNRFRMLKCNDETEWAAAKIFRTKYIFKPYGIEDPYIWTFNHPEHAHLVLYQGTEIIGYAHIQFWPGNRAAMRIIVIEEDKRKQNAGSIFLVFIEKWLKSLEVKSIHAESRQSSLRFYLKNGYTEMPFNAPEEHESDPSDIAVGKILGEFIL